MKVALLLPKPTDDLIFGFGVEHIGLLYISSFLVKAGHQTVVIDQHLHNLSDKDILKSIKQFDPDVIGISIIDSSSRAALKLAKKCKNIKNVPVIAGGVYPTLHPEIVSHSAIDVAVQGEGEQTLEEIIQRLSDKTEIRGSPGTSYLENDTIEVIPRRDRMMDLDAIPFPDRRFSNPKYLKGHKFFFLESSNKCGPMSILTSRGCQMNCGFCISKILWGGMWKGRTPENVIAEIEQLEAVHEIDKIIFVDEEINQDRERALELYGLMKEHPFNLIWATESSVSCMDMEIAKSMVEAGLRSLFIGFESGAPSIIKKLGKAFDIRRGLELSRYFQKRGVFLTASFIVGFPWESQETILQTRQYVKQLNLDISVATYYRPETGTAFYNMMVRKGLYTPFSLKNPHDDPFLPYSKTFYLSAEEVEKAFNDFMFASFIRPKYFLSIAYRMIKNPHRIKAYAGFFKWAFLCRVNTFFQKLETILHKILHKDAIA